MSFSHDFLNLSVLYAGMDRWHLEHTARETAKLGALSGYWVGNGCSEPILSAYYRRIIYYRLAQKVFYSLPFADLEEVMRWRNLPFYDLWMRGQKLPEGTNVVQGPMGSCLSLFKLADASSTKVLKVFDAPNSHPKVLQKNWQDECDKFHKGYKVPMPDGIWGRIEKEINNADVVLCPSQFVRDSMVNNGVPAEKCMIAHFGVNTEIFTPRPSLPERHRFLCVGSLTLRKGQQYLLRAFEIFKRKHPDSELIIVGGVRPDFKEEIKKWEGTFIHYESVPHSELAKIFQSCTAFILPSVEEGFARVLSEAMASALPILASYESGATTVVEDGVHGLIVAPRDPENICEAMTKVTEDSGLNLAMGKESYNAGAKSNTWADYAVRLLSEYQKRLADFS